MKHLFLVIAIFSVSLSFSTVQAQSDPEPIWRDSVYERTHVRDRVPIEYQYMRETDVMWEKVIWRKIDLREKMNHPLYYPEDPIGTRMSLIDLLLHGVEHGLLTAYDPTDPYNEFKIPLQYKQVKEDRFSAKDEVNLVQDVETGEMIEKKIEGVITSSEVKEYLVKELWYFDNQRSTLDVRILGLCPVRYFYKPEDIDREDVQKRLCFWISFAEARPMLANHEIFNQYNDAQQKSFDDMFFQRRFSSYIVQESNPYNNRSIIEYTMGVESLLEAEKIKRSILNYEVDMWSY